ncbi:LOW QUALITY PROTEIN: hypothetical protein V2J09_008738 [Rumex salicifolius]
MADKCPLSRAFPAFFFFLLFSSSMAASSRILSNRTAVSTSILDVAASRRQALLHLSSKQLLQPQFFEEEANQKKKRSSHSSASASLSLPLHTRASIHGSIVHSRYESLTRSRLERDSLRVKSLQTRLDLAVNGIRKSDLKPLSANLEAEALEGPVVSGTSQGSGEYFSRVGIGRPAKQAYVVLDTGSDVSWIQCQPCADCYQQTDPIFDPAASSSYSSVNCESPQCDALDVSECHSDRCLYEVSYGDGSYTVGDFATETISLGEASVDNVAIGCGHNNEGLFVGAAGLLGLGGGKLSFPAQINAKSFSYCLVDRDSNSASTVEFNSPPAPDAVTVPLLHNRQLDTFYYLQITGISVGGDILSLPPDTFMVDETGNGGVIIDSGTAITRLQTEVYDALRDAFAKGTDHLPSAEGVALFDTCYDLSSMSSVEVPSVALHFPALKAVSLPAKNYMIPVDDAGTFCLAFAPTTSSPSIIGNVQQQGTRVTLDLANSLVSFASNKWLKKISYDLVKILVVSLTIPATGKVGSRYPFVVHLGEGKSWNWAGLISETVFGPAQLPQPCYTSAVMFALKNRQIEFLMLQFKIPASDQPTMYPSDSDYPTSYPPLQPMDPFQAPTAQPPPVSAQPSCWNEFPLSGNSTTNCMNVEPLVDSSTPMPWSTGLCDCCEDIHSCCMTCCCPCITFGRIAEIVDRGSTSCGISGSLYMMMMCLMGCPWIYSCSYRTKLRGQYALAEGPCSDCCVHCCCGPCALCQEYRQLSNQGFVMSIGWHGNEELNKIRRPTQTAPIVQGGMDR